MAFIISNADLYRYRTVVDGIYSEMRNVVTRHPDAQPPTASFSDLEKTYTHLAYGTLRPCHVSHERHDVSSYCAGVLNDPVVQRILEVSDQNIPTLIIPFKRIFATHLRLTHFDRNTFNVTVIWLNSEAAGHDQGDGVLVGLDESYEVEWVNAGREGGGLAFKGGFWGREELDSDAGEPECSTEVWFKLVGESVP